MAVSAVVVGLAALGHGDALFGDGAPGVTDSLAFASTACVVVIWAISVDQSAGVGLAAPGISWFQRQTLSAIISGFTALGDGDTAACFRTPALCDVGTVASSTNIRSERTSDGNLDAGEGQVTKTERRIYGEAISAIIRLNAALRDYHARVRSLTELAALGTDAVSAVVVIEWAFSGNGVAFVLLRTPGESGLDR